MQQHILKGYQSNYVFFPNETSTILHNGNFAISYLAADIKTKQKFVCKKIIQTAQPNDSARLKFFVESTIKIQEHKSFAKIIDIAFDNNQMYILQEFINGYTLSELIYSKEYKDKKYNYFFLNIISECLEALSLIHSQQLCVCDLKPTNIMIVADKSNIDFHNPEIKLIDLGCIKPSFKEDILDAQSNRLNIMYSSPEQIFNFSELVGDHSDIFSIGLILFESIAKKTALDISNPAIIKRLQTAVKIEQTSRINDELYEIISKACHKPDLFRSEKMYDTEQLKVFVIKSMNERYQTAMNFRTKIIELLNH